MDRVNSAQQGAVSLSYPLAVGQRVPDLEVAERFLSSVLDIPVRERGVGYLRLDNGSICLWLVQGEGQQSSQPLTVVMAAPDVERAVVELSLRPEVRVAGAPRWTGPNRFEAVLEVGSWLRLVVGRTYDEDELGVIPELRTELEWQAPARELLKALLRQVPVSFRESAREKSVARGEALAASRGQVVVEKYDAVRALVQVTPRFQHALLRDTLRELAEDLTPFDADFAQLDEETP